MEYIPKSCIMSQKYRIIQENYMVSFAFLCYDNRNKSIPPHNQRKEVTIMTHMKLRFQEMNQIVDFVNLMNQFEVDADIKFGHIVVDAKSLLGVMNIAQKKEVELILHSDVADLPPLSEQLAVYAA